jgi:uncharacterized membrane protein YtjA (UPF0391 family)
VPRRVSTRADRTPSDPPATPQAGDMLRAAIALFVIALVAALFGFTGLAAGVAGIAKILFYCFIALAVLSVVGGLAFGRRRW